MKETFRVLNIFMVLDRGGAESFVMNIYRNIDRSKVQFDFLVHGEKKGAYEEEIEAMGGRIFRLPDLSLTNLPKYLKAVDDFFNEHKEEYKVIHSHASELGCFIFQKAKKYKIPYRVCHAHNAPKGFTLKTPIRYLFKKYMQLFTNVRFACGNKAGIWQYGNGKNFEVINNVIEIDKFRFNAQLRETMRRKYCIADDTLVVGHVGRFEKQKNHSFLIDIFSEIVKKRNSVLVLVGDGSLKEEIIEKVEKKGIQDKVIFAGTQKNVENFFQMMDVFVFPSLFEGFPVTLVEAQSNGLNCFVSSNISSETNITDLIKQLSLNQSYEKWANKIIDIKEKDNREKYAIIVKESGYDVNVSAKRLQDFYLECYM